MTSDKNRFLTLKKERYGSILFGNDNSAKMICEGTVKLGHKLLFELEKSEIRKEGSQKLVATTRRIPNNIYVLNEIGREIMLLRIGK
jgi:hypothetical protein